MSRHDRQQLSGEDLFVGIDLHKRKWHVTIRMLDVELFSGSIPGTWESLRRLLDRYKGNRIQVVYEAGCFVTVPLPCLKSQGLNTVACSTPTNTTFFHQKDPLP